MFEGIQFVCLRFYGSINTSKVMASQSALFLDRLRSPKQLTSTKHTYFRQYWQLPYLNKW